MTAAGWPSVTVVVPTGDRPAELRRALASILAQDYPGVLTCVVVFDGSEPFDLSDVPTPAERDTLVVTRNVRTPGRAGARNTGVDNSFSDLVAFCDDGDEWVAGKLSAQVEALHAGEGARVALSGVEYWRDGVRTPVVPAAISVTNEDLCRVRAPELHASSLVVDREAYETTIGPFDEACPGGYGLTYEWLLRASAPAPMVVVRDPLVRVHDEVRPGWNGRWQAIVEGIPYLLGRHPELRGCRRLLSRLERSMAFAYAGLGRAREGVPWALRSLRHSPGEKGSYLAVAAGAGLVRTPVIERWTNRSTIG
jgi:glycosyltransferase involved in cell wall biosynthesis